MEPAPLGTPRRRPRRGSAERPIDVRLGAKVAVLTAIPLLVAVLTVARPGPFPAPLLPPSFDGASATALARELVEQHPNRVPGTPGADAAARWFREKVALYGLRTRVDTWTADVPGLGVTTLRNLAVVVPGTLEDAIAIVAHRDNRSGSAGANDNASGTAALVELARGFATVGTGGAGPRQPLHTLVFLSTDGGAYGGLGSERFARLGLESRPVVASIVLDGVAGASPVRVDVAGLGPTSPAPALLRTAESRLDELTGRTPERAGVVSQLTALGIPFAYGEQGPLLRGGTPAIRLTTAPDAGTPPGADELAALNPARLTAVGEAADATLGSLDGAVELPPTTAPALFLGEAAVRGWALEALLLTLLLPYLAVVVDLLGRCRRRRLPLAPAWRALRRRSWFWIAALVGVGAVAVAGALPTDGTLPPAPDLPPLDDWPEATVVIAALALVGAWLRSRAARPERAPSAEDQLAGWAVTLTALGIVAVVVALASPFTLVFVLPSLYAWLALAHFQTVRPWLCDVLFGLGLAGPVVALVVLAEQLSLGVRAPLYGLALLTSGVVPLLGTIALTGWAIVATQVGALLTGTYAPVQRSSGR